MPGRGEEDDDGSPASFDVGVEMAKEVVFLARRNERIDEHRRVVGLVVHTADLARLALAAWPVLPVRMVGGPAPEALGYPDGIHSYLTSGVFSSFPSPSVNSIALSPCRS